MRTLRPLALVLAVALLLASLAGCAPKAASTTSAEATTTPKPLEPAEIRLGNLPTEDILPLWVAQKEGLFEKNGIKVTIVPFQSAQERDAAYAANAIDGFMGDMIATSELTNAGYKTRIASLCLGSTPAEGRFAILARPNSSADKPKDLAGVAIGTSSGTIQEYVLDKLMEQGGVAADQVKKEEVKKVPVRFQLLMNNELKAAALPEPFVSLAIKQGAHLVAADTQGQNISQTVLSFSQNYLAKPEGAEAVKRLLVAWDEGAKLVNAKPNAYRDLLVEKARLPKPVASSYAIQRYPMHQLPQQPEVDAVLAWMTSKSLLGSGSTLAYSDLVWQEGQQLESSTSPSESLTSTGSAPATP